MARTLEQERAAIEKDVRKLEERRQRLEEKEREAAIQAIEKTGLLKLETKRLGNRARPNSEPRDRRSGKAPDRVNSPRREHARGTDMEGSMPSMSVLTPQQKRGEALPPLPVCLRIRQAVRPARCGRSGL